MGSEVRPRDDLRREDVTNFAEAVLSSITDAMELHEAPSSLWATSVLQVALVNVVSGLLYGYGVGFIGPFATLTQMSANCSVGESEVACASLAQGSCNWAQDTSRCLFSDGIECAGRDEESCSADDFHTRQCVWEADAGFCNRNVGFTAFENGWFAGAMIIGGACSSSFAGWFTVTIGHRRAFVGSGLIAIMSAVVTHVAVSTGDFAALMMSRFVLGWASGLTCVAGPMYVEEMTPSQHRQTVGVLFQVACTLGILWAAAMGLVLQPRSFTDEMNFRSILQLYSVPSTIIAVLVALVGFVTQESRSWLLKQHMSQHSERTLPTIVVGDAPLSQESERIGSSGQQTGLLWGSPGASSVRPRSRQGQYGVGATENDVGDLERVDEAMHGVDGADDTRQYTLAEMRWTLLTAFMLCLAQQMTGINAIMNYAPRITKVVGLQPLLGNFFVMAWNFVTTLCAIPLASRWPLESMYIWSLLVVALACLATGIPVFPELGVPAQVKNGICSAGIAVFILAFETGMGGGFWALTQSLFPPAFRARGSSFAVMTQFLMNIVVNICFPIAVEGLSGGPSGSQDTGMAVVFVFFGTVGIASWMYLLRFLRSWEATMRRSQGGIFIY